MTTEISRLEKFQSRAVKKIKDGADLTHSEELALEGKAFFSFCFDYDEYKTFVNMVTLQSNSTPNAVIWALIEKFMEENTPY